MKVRDDLFIEQLTRLLIEQAEVSFDNEEGSDKKNINFTNN